MHVELVEVVTQDGVHLHGAWQGAANPASAERRVPWGVICLHGTGANFYASRLLKDLVPGWLEAGVGVLRVNTRGHDLISTALTASGGRLQGAAYERVDDCRHDVQAWIDFLVQRGVHHVLLAGHSLGGVKVLYSQAHQMHSHVRGMIAISPPRLSYSRFLSGVRAADFKNDYAKAAAMRDAGEPQALIEVRFPLRYSITAAGFLDKYSPEESCNFVPLLAKIGVPVLCTFGSDELTPGSAFDGLPEELRSLGRDSNQLTVEVIPRANHIYTGRSQDLWERIHPWVTKQQVAAANGHF